MATLLRGLPVPTLAAFELAVGRLSQQDASFRSAVVEAAERIVATQKTVHPAEQEALDCLRKRLAESRQEM
jgi:hypothetical protein